MKLFFCIAAICVMAVAATVSVFKRSQGGFFILRTVFSGLLFGGYTFVLGFFFDDIGIEEIVTQNAVYPQWYWIALGVLACGAAIAVLAGTLFSSGNTQKIAGFFGVVCGVWSVLMVSLFVTGFMNFVAPLFFGILFLSYGLPFWAFGMQFMGNCFLDGTEKNHSRWLLCLGGLVWLVLWAESGYYCFCMSGTVTETYFPTFLMMAIPGGVHLLLTGLERRKCSHGESEILKKEM